MKIKNALRRSDDRIIDKYYSCFVALELLDKDISDANTINSEVQEKLLMRIYSLLDKLKSIKILTRRAVMKVCRPVREIDATFTK